MYSSIKSCIKINESEITEMFSCNRGIRQGDGLSPVPLPRDYNSPLMSFISTLKNGNSKLIQKNQMSSYSVETNKINTKEILNMRTKY